MSIQVCRDPSDAVALYLPQRLYLKSFAKLNISIQLPLHKVHGKSISNWELMEKLRKVIQPESFSILKVSKHSSEVIRFDAELESRNKLDMVISRLDERVIQLNDYPDPLKVKVSEAKSDFPSRHSWDSFFRDATDMDEMKPGERPDTIHIANLPIKWFVHHKDKDENAPPSESIFKKVFEKYGSIRQADVPLSDPFRMQMKTAMRGITTSASDLALYFEGYVQFSEYVGFVRCMDALRGMKLLRKKDDLAEWCSIKVDFDKTKHMTDAAVKRRAIVRERLASRQRAKDEEDRAEKDVIAKRQAKEHQRNEHAEREKLEKMREREGRRKKKQLAKLLERDGVNISSLVAEEQKKLLKTQKKVQAVRLIEELFKRIELRPELQRNGAAGARYYSAGERSARARIVDKCKAKHEQALEAQRERLKQALDGRIVIRSVLETKKPKRDTSISSISSEEAVDDRHRNQKKIKTERLTTPERQLEYSKAAAMYGMPYGSYAYPFAPPPYAYQPSAYYAVRGYYPGGARRGRGRGAGRARPRMPYFDGPDASHQYYQYFKKLTAGQVRNDHNDRRRSRSRSRTRSRSRSRSRSRARSRRRSYSRSRSHSRRRSRSRSRRSRSRRSRSRSHHSRSRSKSRSHRKSRSRSSRRSRSRSRSRSKPRTHTPKTVDAKLHTPSPVRRRSKSWSLPKEQPSKSWSKSPRNK